MLGLMVLRLSGPATLERINLSPFLTEHPPLFQVLEAFPQLGGGQLGLSCRVLVENYTGQLAEAMGTDR